MKNLVVSNIGPFEVLNLSNASTLFDAITVSKYGMEEVKPGQKTEAHTHDFPSYYKSKDLNLVHKGQLITIPAQALVVVPPGVDHSWIPQNNYAGAVGSVDDRHSKQVITE